MANLIRSQVMEICRGYPQGNGRMVFPGSQPVSLDTTNLTFLQVRRSPSCRRPCSRSAGGAPGFQMGRA